MLSFVADENFDGDIVRTVLSRRPNLDLVRVQDVGLSGVDDPALLEWAATQGRIVLTHDAATLIGHAYDRVRRGASMPGVLEVRQRAPKSAAAEDILIAAEASTPEEWEGQVRYVPL